MEPNAILDVVRAGLKEVTPRVADLVASLPDATAPILPKWTARDVAVHLINETNQAAEEASGAPSPHVFVDADQFSAQSDARLADIPETDP
ncbi:MAG: maleylpyruvate isomerase N-terminal domain-containing protein, partial [Acidimicrobiales bacterium]